MEQSYIAVHDPVHHLVRTLTRVLPLVPEAWPGQPPSVAHRFSPAELPSAYYFLATLHSVGGMPLDSLAQARWVPQCDQQRILEHANYFDLTWLDRRCCRDLRLKLRATGPGLIAAELLAFGTGMLRARNDDPYETLHVFLRNHYGALHSGRQTVYATLRALHPISNSFDRELGKESYDSTNLIYGDALGEVEQLWERRAETDLLDAVAASLRRLSRDGEVSAHFHPPQNVRGLLALHLKRQARWKTPPANGRALLRRVEFILENTRVELGAGTRPEQTTG